MLISRFIRKVSYGQDFEAHLAFYMDCRGHFTALDASAPKAMAWLSGLTTEHRIDEYESLAALLGSHT